MSVVRFGVSLEQELLSALDGYIKDNHLSNRSQAIRQLINNNITYKGEKLSVYNGIKGIKGSNGYNKLIVPKCAIVGFCPEEKSCPMIFSYVKKYNEKFHQEMKKELKKKFEDNLKKLAQ